MFFDKMCNFFKVFVCDFFLNFFLSIFDICAFSSTRKPIPRSEKKLLMVVSFNGFVSFNNLAIRILKSFC